MAVRRSGARTSGPVNVAMNGEQRRRFQGEARRRGLGVSSTVRTLALERLAELDDDRQLARARQWQLEHVRAAVDAFEHGETTEASWDEIERIFDARA